ncbi:MAG: hypothetical protein IJ301_02235 [Clostridia bacterium]|nr:hypothetical protein [Clostridia bacterium]
MDYVITATYLDERKLQNIIVRGREPIALGIAFFLEHDRNIIEVNVYKIDEKNPMGVVIYKKNILEILK